MVRLFLALLFSPLCAEVTAFYLSWYGDPTTTMTIQWIAPMEEELWVEIEGQWQKKASSSHPVHSFLVSTAHLDHLSPDTEYRFRFADKTYKFRTAPTTLPIRFVVGGDAYSVRKLFRRMNQTVAALDPLFAVIGGDIAYAIYPNPFRLRSTPFNRWLTFLKDWSEQMITPDGRVIPFLLASGNHDMEPDNYELFFSLFSFPERQLYRTLDFGRYLSLFLLDTGHFQPIAGRQTYWLKQTLSTHTEIPYRFAIYHVAAYPSFYSYDAPSSKAIRAHWCPLFDQYGLSAVFENHNHTFKRTYPLKNDQIDENGTIYLGGGAWGVSPRRPNEMWYLEKKARKNNVYCIDLTADAAHIEAIDLVGNSLDEITMEPLPLLQPQVAHR